jgi:hypothetical protein
MLQLETVANFDEGGHHFRVVRPQDEEAFLAQLAKEYLLLRTATVCDVKDISIDGIAVVSAEAILERLKRATIPARGRGNFTVARSDFGETLAYALLSQEYGTRFGYKSVRDRELIQLPGRGIDAVGVEPSRGPGVPLTLLFGETKVSAEAKSPPQVVDRGDDCLRAQHRGHLNDREATANKIFDLARKSVDPEVQQMLFAATLGFEGSAPVVVRIAASSTLVRPECHHTAADFGSFRASPVDFAPAVIRFWILRTDSPIEEMVDRWYAKVTESAAS